MKAQELMTLLEQSADPDAKVVMGPLMGPAQGIVVAWQDGMGNNINEVWLHGNDSDDAGSGQYTIHRTAAWHRNQAFAVLVKLNPQYIREFIKEYIGEEDD